MKPFKLAIVFLLFLSLLGCGGGGDSGASNDLGSSTANLSPDSGASNDLGSNTGNLPPDPGEAGKSTLQGVDSDNDGVRDDVQIAIYERYPNDEIKRNALTQKAKALQDAIVAGDSSSSYALNQASKLVIDAVDCLHERVDDPTAEIGFLEQKMVNTSDRNDAYIKFNEALSGQFFGGDGANNPCQ